ncbi:MAG: choice-of-anchor V domain-containing protein [Vicingaceae bacterium]
MKKTLQSIFLLSLALISIKVLLSSSSQGRANAANSGNTGAPSESQVCGSCHTGGSFGATTYQIQLLDNSNNPVNSYVPGSVYTLRGSYNTPIGNNAPTRYGFQVVSLIDNNNATYNAWSSPSANAQIASAANGRSYTEHDGPSASNSYTVSWTAPPAGSGSVTFYSAANGVNLNGGTRGDNGYSDQLTITENTSTSLAETKQAEVVNFYPNPVKETLFLTTTQLLNTELVIYDLSGSKVKSIALNANQKESVDMSQLSKGIYFLRWADQAGRFYSKKLIKQ